MTHPPLPLPLQTVLEWAWLLLYFISSAPITCPPIGQQKAARGDTSDKLRSLTSLLIFLHSLYFPSEKPLKNVFHYKSAKTPSRHEALEIDKKDDGSGEMASFLLPRAKYC